MVSGPVDPNLEIYMAQQILRRDDLARRAGFSGAGAMGLPVDVLERLVEGPLTIDRRRARDAYQLASTAYHMRQVHTSPFTDDPMRVRENYPGEAEFYQDRLDRARADLYAALGMQ